MSPCTVHVCTYIPTHVCMYVWHFETGLLLGVSELMINPMSIYYTAAIDDLYEGYIHVA